MGPIKQQDHVLSLGKYFRELDGLAIDSGHREIGRGAADIDLRDGILSPSRDRSGN
jgi:hypothetical protein